MNRNKILLFTAILVIAISSLAIVSAGLFDSNNDANKSNNHFSVTFVDSMINYQFGDNVTSTAQIQDNNTIKYSNQRKDVNYTGFVSLNLTNLTDEQIKMIETNSNKGNNSLFLFTNMSLKNHGSFTLEFNDCKYTVNDKIINIEINSADEIPMDSINQSFPTSGTIHVDGGHFDLPNVTLGIEQKLF